MNYYNEKMNKIYDEMDSSIDGLSSKDVRNRTIKYGSNSFLDGKKTGKLTIFLRQFNDPMVLMLIIVSIISIIYSYFSGESYTDSIVIVFIIILNVIMGFFEESKSESSIESLKKIDKYFVKVKRDNIIKSINAVNLVPGDIILLEAGDQIPADARIIDSFSAKVDESVLTGESEPVNKKEDILKGELTLSERTNMIYKGSSLLHGKITAIVVTTGMNTEIGKIAEKLNEKHETPTPLEQKISEISNKISIVILVIIGFIFLVNIIYLKSNILDVIMLCISLIVSAVPEGLPTVITISLSLGTRELSKKKALIRTLRTVETLGATEIICSDKTGTITQNKMTVKEVYTGNPTNKLSSSMINIMYLCNTVDIQKEKLVGDPTETALIDYLKEHNSNDLKKLKKNNCILELSFDSERKMMSTINNIGGKEYLLVKGSLDAILNASTYFESYGNVKKLSKSKKSEIKSAEEEYASKALRVLAFAYREIKPKEYKNKNDEKIYDIEKDLIFTGLVGMIDPEREGVAESIAECKKAGITPIMITGDSLDTAIAIAKNIGLLEEESKVIEGIELSKYSDKKLKKIVKNYSVYARVSPEDKVRIVKAWQANNKIVAMTGDGVNDAPAIKLSDIGIGMGKNGTDVAKSSADLILTDDCFNTIVSAVKEGRRIYNNIRNVILYSLSSNFAEIFIVLVGIILGFNILLPIQILFIDLVTDTIFAIGLAFEEESKGIMEELPHDSKNKFFTPYMTMYLLTSSIVECLLILGVYLFGARGIGAATAQSMVFLCLIIQEGFFSFNCRSSKELVSKQGIFSNKYINYGFLLSTITILLVYLIDPLKNLLHLTQINISSVILIILLNLIAYLFLEAIKPFYKKHFKD